ncbi:hypothetical protein HAX54_021090 [Datura stramonium]|uniref:Purple acid phosphatase Fn3-like domain-containing protein n=1 Tax=Datura stramonium TaxID=4076 RepID=A0ABS8US38_DATST|nr:hypothetical protein [Datura stramonium]
MRKQYYFVLWVLSVVLSLINGSVVSTTPKYIRLGKQEHGQMEQPLSGIQIHKTVLALTKSASIQVAGPTLLGPKGEDVEWVTINLRNAHPSEDDWVGVFSPAKFK